MCERERVLIRRGASDNRAHSITMEMERVHAPRPFALRPLGPGHADGLGQAWDDTATLPSAALRQNHCQLLRRH